MQRSGWKIPYISPIFFSKVFIKSKRFNTDIRNTTIAPVFVGKRMGIYAGYTLKSVNIRRHLVGDKLGAYCITKIFGSAIGESIGLKEKHKKEDKKKGKK